MQNAFATILRTAWLVVLVSCTVFLTLHLVQRSPWYKNYVYKRLFATDEKDQWNAASTLVQLGGEQQLLRAIRAEQPGPRSVAKKALEYLWFNSSGPKAFAITQTAYHAAEKQDFTTALKLLDQVVQQFPKFAEGWNQRASIHWQMGEYEKSINDSRQALLLNPNHYGAWQGMGVCRLKLGDPREACRCLRAALKILPHDETTKKALESCEEVLRQQPGSKPADRGYQLI